MKNKLFASYEKEIRAAVTITRHTVRMLLNSTAMDLKSSLQNVPNDATLIMVSDEDDHGELIFEDGK